MYPLNFHSHNARLNGGAYWREFLRLLQKPRQYAESDLKRLLYIAYSNGPQTNARFTPAVKLSIPSINFSLLIRTSVI